MELVDRLLRAGKFDDARARVLRLDQRAIDRGKRRADLQTAFDDAIRDGLVVKTARLKKEQ